MFLTLYDVLGLSPNCNQCDIKKAYHRKSLELHPDKMKVSNCQLFVNMKKAYDILSNNINRASYDASIKSQLKRSKEVKKKTNDEKLRKTEELRQEALRKAKEFEQKKAEEQRKKEELKKAEVQRKNELNEMKRRMKELIKSEKEEKLMALKKEKENERLREKAIKEMNERHQKEAEKFRNERKILMENIIIDLTKVDDRTKSSERSATEKKERRTKKSTKNTKSKIKDDKVSERVKSIYYSIFTECSFVKT